jgi:hypothetical protein
MLSITRCFGVFSTKNRNLKVSFSKKRFFALLKKEKGLRICMRTHPLAPGWTFAPECLYEEASCKKHEGQGSQGY